MTSHKPFTAEQLDEFERQLAEHGLCTATIWRNELSRFIAQAREEIRLREERDSRNAMWDKVDALAADFLKAAEDPAARAERDLGEWLVEDQCRAFALAEPHSVRMHWECMLWLEYDRGDGPPSFHARGSTEHEAITAALRAAKGEKS